MGFHRITIAFSPCLVTVVVAVVFVAVVGLAILPISHVDTAPMPQRYLSGYGSAGGGGGGSGYGYRGGGGGGGGGGSGYRSSSGVRQRYGYNAGGRGRGSILGSGGRRGNSGGGGGVGYGRRYSPSGRPSSGGDVVDESFAHDFLQQFGYIPKEKNDSRAAASANSVSLEGSIANFQRVAGIPQTGYLDKTTKQWMKRPR